MDSARESVPEVAAALKWKLRFRDEDIALALGMTRSSVNNRMAGRVAWTYWELIGLAELFGVPVDTFFASVPEALTRVAELGVEPRPRLRRRPTDGEGADLGEDAVRNRCFLPFEFGRDELAATA